MSSCHNQDGIEIQISTIKSGGDLGASSGYLHGHFRSPGALIEHIQLFIDWSDNAGYEVELSFFPTDLASTFTLDQFLGLLHQWWDALESDEVFVRYENASWDYCEPNGLGVFYHDKRDHKNG